VDLVFIERLGHERSVVVACNAGTIDANILTLIPAEYLIGVGEFLLLQRLLFLLPSLFFLFCLSMFLLILVHLYLHIIFC
jgi:hypothetical protein